MNHGTEPDNEDYTTFIESNFVPSLVYVYIYIYMAASRNSEFVTTIEAVDINILKFCAVMCLQNLVSLLSGLICRTSNSDLRTSRNVKSAINLLVITNIPLQLETCDIPLQINHKYSNRFI
jgi:hypothetical protein